MTKTVGGLLVAAGVGIILTQLFTPRPVIAFIALGVLLGVFGGLVIADVEPEAS